MKLVCDSCGTKYSVGDDRVAGKVFKIRCKKCANVMVVRGAAVEAAPPPTETLVPNDEWHAVIEGVQSGPFSRVDLMRKHASGVLDGESYVWREGLADWVALGSLEELRAELAAAPSEPTAVTAAPEAAPVADAPRLLAERNESSVLFTLGNLAKLASTPAHAKATPATGGGTEGSGLIDIRALASTFAPAKAARAQNTIGSADDLPVFAPATFGEPIVLVPAARAKGPDRRLLFALIATIAMLAVLAVVLVIVLRGREPEQVAAEPTPTRVATVGGPVGTETTGNAPTGSAPNGNGNGSAPDGGGPNGSAPTGNAPTGNAPNGNAPNGNAPNSGNAPGKNGNGNAPTGNAPTGNAPTRATPTRTTPPTTPARTPTTPNSSRTPTTPTRTPTLTPDKEPNSCNDVSCMVNSYKDPCCEKFKPRGANTPPNAVTNAQLNENLDRNQLAAGIATIRAQACGGKSSAKGDVSVSVKVSADGVVTGVTIKSSPDPALSACVTAAAGRGTFAKTKRGGSFSYMWRF